MRLPILVPTLVVSLVAPWCTATRAIGDEPSTPIARSIRVEATRLGSLEDVLHIRKCSGSYELNSKARWVTLVIDLYREGKKVDTKSFRLGSGIEGAVSGEFSVQVIDLDYLPLGDGNKGHHRIHVALSLGTTAGSTKWDISKTAFEADGAFGSSAFRTNVGTATVVPLFPMVLKTRPDEKGNRGISSGGSIEGVIEENRHNDVLIATLRVDPIKSGSDRTK